MARTSNKSLYLALADEVAEIVLLGTLRLGDRLPSIRAMHEQKSVSLSTVLHAYRVLEDRGLIESRPQSGYFVKQPQSRLPEPKITRSIVRPSKVNVASLAYRLSQVIRSRDVIKLGVAVPAMEFLPLKALNRLLAQVTRWNPELAHSYEPPAGCEELRREIAKRMVEAGCAIAPDELITTTGATEAVHLCLRALTKPGDMVAVESPTYFGLLEILETLGLRTCEVATHPRDGIDLDGLGDSLKKCEIKAVVLTSNFSNPLGACMPDDKKRELVALLEKRRVSLIEDDVYGDLAFEGNRPRAVKAYDTSDNVLYCASFSKTLSPGMRVGWCAPGRYRDVVTRMKMNTTLCTAPAPQLAVAAFLAQGGYERHLRGLRRRYRDLTERMTAAIRTHFPENTRVSRPAGGHVLWLEFPPSFDSLALHEAAIRHNISIAPGPLFSPRGKFRHCLRLNSGVPASPELDDALKTLGKLASEQNAS